MEDYVSCLESDIRPQKEVLSIIKYQGILLINVNAG